MQKPASIVSVRPSPLARAAVAAEDRLMVRRRKLSTDRRVRRWRSVSEKLQIVQLTLKPGASVAEVARAHGVNANQVFKWRRAFERGELSEPVFSAAPGHGVNAKRAAREEMRSERQSQSQRWRDSHRVSWSSDDQRRERRRSLSGALDPRESAQVIQLPAGTKIWIAAGVTDMRRGFDGLSAQVQTVLATATVLRTRVCISRTQRRHRKASVVGRRWPVSVCQAPGAWPIHLAEG